MKVKSNLKVEDIEAIFTGRTPGAEDDFKFFSVLVPLIEKDGRLYLLYEVRAKHMVRQPGEICFPGGELEPDENTCECALRETYEEIGIDPEDIRIVSQLDTVYTYSSFAMYCYLGIVNAQALEHLKLNPDEVDEVFLVSLDDLMACQPEIYRTELIPEIPENFPYDKVTGGKPYNWRRGRGCVPVYDVDGRIIWGLTARITKRFLDIIKKHDKGKGGS